MSNSIIVKHNDILSLLKFSHEQPIRFDQDFETFGYKKFSHEISPPTRANTPYSQEKFDIYRKIGKILIKLVNSPNEVTYGDMLFLRKHIQKLDDYVQHCGYDEMYKAPFQQFIVRLANFT